jgi:hypothetical protein
MQKKKLSRGLRTLSITKARQELCPIVENIDALPEGKLSITVGEKVAAYIVSPDRLAALEARTRKAPRSVSLRGTVQILGDLEEGSRDAGREIERMALESWKGRGH